MMMRMNTKGCMQMKKLDKSILTQKLAPTLNFSRCADVSSSSRRKGSRKSKEKIRIQPSPTLQLKPNPTLPRVGLKKIISKMKALSLASTVQWDCLSRLRRCRYGKLKDKKGVASLYRSTLMKVGTLTEGSTGGTKLHTQVRYRD